MEQSKQGELVPFFMPFSGVQFSRDTPILAYLFEGQEDQQISEHFPELEARRKSIDKITKKGDETVTLQSLMRDGKALTAGMVYIKYPWKKRKELDVSSIIFLREVANRTVFAVKRVREEGFGKVIILLPSRFSPQNVQDRIRREQLYFFVRTIAESIVYANNPYEEHINQPDKKLVEVTFVFFGESQPALDGFFRKTIGDGVDIGNSLAYTRKLTETPPNLKPPIRFIEYAIGRPLGLKKKNEWQKISMSSSITAHLLYGLEALKSQGFQLVAGVGAGSNHEPCLLKVHYKPKTKRKKRVRRIVLTGKGVTFDSGGYNIKREAEHYKNMHYDVAGAATLLGAMKLAEEKNLPVELIGIMPIVENMVSSKATPPGTILNAYGGKSVEIVNTDCEGRLLMAEAIAFADKKFRADAIITIATLGDLSGFGPDFLKVVVTNKILEKKVGLAERLSSEKMLLFPPIEHFNHIDDMHIGEQSDLINDVEHCYHTSPIAFMYNFFSQEPVNWVFIDISAVFESWAPDYGAGPGFGLKFLWHLLQQFT